jgi:hypothetical protein
MKYFYHIQVNPPKEKAMNFFILSKLTDLPDGNITPLAKEMTAEKVKQNPAYAAVARKNHNRVMVVYTIYQTESELQKIAKTNFAENLQLLIDGGDAVQLSCGELVITNDNSSPARGGKKKKRKSSKKLKIMSAFLAVISLLVGIGIGMNIRSGEIAEESGNILRAGEGEFEGLIMPEMREFPPNAQLVTITIDRSYFAVPRENIQLQGAVANGAATITLPAFDRRDFFHHVPGHTWGFSTDPNASRIEYYGGATYQFTEDVKLYRVLTRFGGGSGTVADPYIIDFFDQLQLMSREQVRGHFRQTANIEFPDWARHTPINTVSELRNIPELLAFEYDGGGFSISGLNAPLFGRVSGALIQNVNIRNSFIETTEHRNMGFIVNEAFNFRYETDGRTYETGETIIRNSTVNHSAFNIRYPEEYENEPPDYDDYDGDYDDGHEGSEPAPRLTSRAEFAVGGISGLGGQIENCYVTDVGIFVEISSNFLYAGGISGKPANVVNSGVYHLAIRGNIFHIGGISGSAGGSRLHRADGSGLSAFYGGNIQGCFVRRFTGEAINSAGGIAGEASTNAANAVISNNYSTELALSAGIFANEERSVLIRRGFTGGIIGSDGNDRHGHLLMNSVSPIGLPVVGAASNSVYNTNADDGSVWLAPTDAFYRESILEIVNRNAVHPENPSEMFAGTFIFASDGRNSDEGGRLPFPAGIAELLLRFNEGN